MNEVGLIHIHHAMVILTSYFLEGLLFLRSLKHSYYLEAVHLSEVIQLYALSYLL